MIQIAPGDLVAVEAEGRYYYAFILDKVRLFGGNWAFVLHASSEKVRSATEVLSGPRTGLHAFVDFIWAKRERRLLRLARTLDTASFRGPGFLRGTTAIKEKAQFWVIYDMSFKELRCVTRLTPEEERYPDYIRIDDVLMVQKVKQGWAPEQDPRI